MGINTDFKLIKEKKIDKDTTLKMSKNIMSGRIFVEFTSVGPKLTLQKNFQDTYDGKMKAEEFSKSIKTTKELREYFGIKESK